ncbi:MULTISPECIES: tetratricopeptide repeat protein [Pseudomonas]|uniref:tetratricopeptide repeat protein n=1 Tax=Pseudomonas TaxID=286 RepID=UPI00235FBAB1|nr:MULTISPECIES: tetratricopeptide repeat protein [Pseudomonas]WJV25553.1 tetratricopeptide repeat protein [Pseudomonas chlororaphis]
MSVDAMRVRHCYSAIIAMLGGILLSTAAAHAKLPVPDWKTLQFTCTKEQNPPLDPDADKLFLKARELEKKNNQANDRAMLELYQEAADKGHHKAMLNLAGLYIRGTGVPKDERRAVDFVEKALRLNSPHAFYLMGVMLQQGIGVKKDEKSALSYFRRSADLGNRYGQQAAGEAIRDAFIQQPEPNRSRGYTIAVQRMECALGQDLAEAGYALGLHFLTIERDVSRALESFQRGAALGHEKSLYMLYSTFKEGSNGVEKDPRRAACYDKRWAEAQAEPGKKFPDIDRLCPLPPQSARTGASGQPSPRVGLWHQAGNPTEMFRAATGDSLPLVDGLPVHWEWEASRFEGSRLASGQSCPWPGIWACEDLPIGAREFAHGETLPEVDGRPVTWRLVPRA